ncbi:MAG TPA: bifunctional phosphoglucose/phosphomannose isomerase [Gemmatimonadota bacterium]|nr:bifunctional phosphoglucose/phosphomannose isomerase [Gemmatimonadota bacterium]
MTEAAPLSDARIAEWRSCEARLDTGGMRAHIAGFPDQLAAGVERAAPFVAHLPRPDPPASAVLVLGMGGSAIGGDLAAAYTADRRRLPVVVHRGYGLPAGLDERAFVVAASYSGNTEETLDGYEAAKARGLGAVVLTTGGRLADRARTAGDPILELPGGYPPRAALGHLLSGCTLSIARLDPGLDAAAESAALKRAAEELRPAVGAWLAWSAENPALQIAACFKDRLPLVYAGHPISIAAARRWKAQLNENGKIPAWVGEFPEHNHNEIVGFVADHPFGRRLCVVYLETPWDEDRVRRRLDFVHRFLAAKGAAQHRIHAAGRSPLATMLRLCALGDCASFLAAIIMGQDPTPVVPIEELKRTLAKGKMA